MVKFSVYLNRLVFVMDSLSLCTQFDLDFKCPLMPVDSFAIGGRQHSFVEIDHEIFSTVIPSLPLIQEGKLSVSCERMCTILVKTPRTKPAQ